MSVRYLLSFNPIRCNSLLNHHFLTNGNTNGKTITIGVSSLLRKQFIHSGLTISQRSMNDQEKTREHEEITVNQTRQRDVFKATVVQTEMLSNSIKGITLQIHGRTFSFKAGQWVDFFIPGMKTFTGYTIASSPHELAAKNELQLAIKYSSYAPTLWVHRECFAGTDVSIRVGGDFFYPPANNNQAPDMDLLLIAGGVGINPLVSILGQFCKICESNKDFASRATLLYSAQTESELVFKSKMDAMSEQIGGNICSVKYFVTREPTIKEPNITCSRISREVIGEELAKLRMGNTYSYICGPSTLIDDTADMLSDCGLPQSRILYEKWW